MDKMMAADWVMLVSVIGMIVALVSNAAALFGKGKDRAAELTEMRSDIKHIREKVDRMDDLPERITKVEESAKQAHRRIDELRDKGGKA